jgi:putative membrane protein
MLLSPSDHEKVKAAVEAAEAATSGEIVCVIANSSSDYGEVPLGWAVGAALIVPGVALALGLHPGSLLHLFGGWTAAHASTVDMAVAEALTAYVIAQAALFLAVLLIASIPAIHHLITPSALEHARVRRRAHHLFAAQGMHLTERRTGVLIYASLAERRAEVIADDAIAAKVGAHTWTEVAGALTAGMKAGDPGAGFAAAIARAAGPLAEHFPRGPDDRNELPDTVIELE